MRRQLAKRMLVIEFADEESEFEALAPSRYFYRGKELLDADLVLPLL